MTISAGTRLGPYEVLSSLGAGGMGEVYQARDTRLGRTVAVKVLPPHLSSSPEVRQRFEREAKTISQLSHPHICALYDVGREGETEYLVMEYLEGETLALRLAKGGLPLDQTLRYGIEIADALDKAHRQGIVHRDLKPSNIMLTKSGVKLLDFGLAKLLKRSDPMESLTSAPTEAKDITREGSILGTIQYMAPEQLEGKEADPRTDVFALGAVLHEMATGRKAFSGGSQASLISSIMSGEPPSISSIQPMAPPVLDRVVKICLAKDPEDRWQSAHDIASELAWIAQAGSQAGAVAPMAAPRRGRDRVAWILGAIAGAAVAALAAWALQRGGAVVRHATTRAAITVPPSETLVLDQFGSIAISPDGRRIVYVARKGKTRQLFQRPLDASEATPIAGTEGASTPFFSPDGQWIAFWADGKVKKVSIAGGTPATICNIVDVLLGGDWGEDDTIIFVQEWGGGLRRVAASGGSSEPLTKPSLKGEDRGHLWPAFLPGGRAILFSVFTGGSIEDFAIAVRNLATGEQKILIKGGRYGHYAASGHILYVRGNTLFAIPFDAKRLALTGSPYPVAQGIGQNTNGGADFAVSRNGTLIMISGGIHQQNRSLLWVDRKGVASPLSAARRPYAMPSVSPDGKRIAVVIQAETYDIWILDIARDSLARLSFGKDDSNPAWSPDGKQVAFTSSQAGPYNIWAKASDGSGTQQRLTSGPEPSFVSSWSHDGKLLAFQRLTASGGPEIWLLPLGGGAAPRPFLQGPYRYQTPQISPDGRWMAYASNQSGRLEVYVTAFPGPGGRSQISNEGGEDPRWEPGGREIFYRTGEKVMRVAVMTSPEFSASRPELLFEGPYEEFLNPVGGAWDIAPDGQHFVMIRDESSESAPKQIDVVLDWFEELKARARESRS